MVAKIKVHSRQETEVYRCTTFAQNTQNNKKKNTAFQKLLFQGWMYSLFGNPGHLQTSLAVQRKQMEAATRTGPFGIRANAAQEKDRENWM